MSPLSPLPSLDSEMKEMEEKYEFTPTFEVVRSRSPILPSTIEEDEFTTEEEGEIDQRRERNRRRRSRQLRSRGARRNRRS